MKKIIYPILAIIAFLFSQVCTGIAFFVAALVANPEKARIMAATADEKMAYDLIGPNDMSLAICISGILTVVLISIIKMIDWKETFNYRNINWRWAATSIIAAALAIFALDICEEALNLPNLLEDTFIKMASTTVGAISIGLVGPVTEELIFREGIEGYMLRNGVNKWVAILTPAIAFGLIHGNPAQIPFAAGVGIILGIIYYKTGNIVITSILHIINNSLFVVQMSILGENAKDTHLIDELGGTVPSAIITVICIATSVALFVMLWKKTGKTTNINNTEL